MDKVTDVSQLREYANGKVVELPSFGDNQPFVARLRRPSMMALAKNGVIPNALLDEAQKLFNNGASAMESFSKKDNILGDMYDICIAVVKASLIEPTYEDIVSAGLELTDEQILTIFSYTQTGVDALKTFRDE